MDDGLERIRIFRRHRSIYDPCLAFNSRRYLFHSIAVRPRFHARRNFIRNLFVHILLVPHTGAKTAHAKNDPDISTRNHGRCPAPANQRQRLSGYRYHVYRHRHVDQGLDYKQQALDALRAEHGAILAQVRAQEQVIENLETEHRQVDEAFTQRKLEGINIVDAMSYETYLRSLEQKLREENRKLERLRHMEEQKRTQVVEARKETATIEKLREHKLEDYRKAEQKDEEQRIEEFVSTTRAMAAMGI